MEVSNETIGKEIGCFSPQSDFGRALRIRIIGIVIIAGELLINLVMIGSAVIVNASADLKGFKLIWIKLISEISLPTVFLGVVVLIIAEIFRLGVRMREEQELTI